MDYGFYISTAGMLTTLHRMDTISNNIANASTSGFKKDLMSFQERAPEVLEDNLPRDLSVRMLDRLGGGVFAAPSLKDFQQGQLNNTGNPFDVAIQGEGFFMVQQQVGEDGTANRLTRDGRLTLDSQGRLVSSTNFRPILDDGGEPIELDGNAQIDIAANGQIFQNGEEVARIGLFNTEDPNALQDLGYGIYGMSAEQEAALTPANGQLQQQFLEQSNVSAVREMTDLIETNRTLQMHANLMRIHDTMMDRAINQVGRVG